MLFLRNVLRERERESAEQIIYEKLRELKKSPIRDFVVKVVQKC